MSSPKPNRVLISGGTGLVGRHLQAQLKAKGYQVRILSRSVGKTDSEPHLLWDVKRREIDITGLKTCAHVIHLAGANIGAKRWTKARKQEIIASRVESTQLLARAIHEHHPRLKTFVSASGLGYYGQQTSDTVYTEEHIAAEDFLGRCCQLWEAASDSLPAVGVRRVILRTGLVLASEDSALQKMALPVSWGLGSTLGNGKQRMPWVHIEDLCAAYIAAIETPEMIGPYNVAVKACPSNIEMTKAIARQLKKPLCLPAIPSFALKLVLGEMASIVTEGSCASNKKLMNTGFGFGYERLDQALADLL